jgi:pectate lyase
MTKLKQFNPDWQTCVLALACSVVMPATGSGQPIITHTTVAAGAIVLSGTGGDPGGTYRVLTSPDASSSVTTWLAIATNVFDSQGDFSSTTPVVPSPMQAYYAIQTVGKTLDFSLFGYGAGATGGAGGPTQTVATASAFQTAAASAGPRTILVSGSLNIGTVNVQSDKTILGVGSGAALVGNLKIDNVTNVIVRNLHLSNPTGGDGITLQDFARRVWIDHCSFGDCSDGQLDITHGSDFITVSWCVFSYTEVQTAHRFSSLVGHNEDNAAEDAGRLQITYHHNWWSTLVHERTPRVRFGKIHALNNLFWSPGNNYCIRTGIQAQVLSEHNYFRQVDEPYDKITELGETGLIRNLGCEFENCTGIILYDDPVFTPPYSYAADAVADVPQLVTEHAGVGKGPFAP